MTATITTTAVIEHREFSVSVLVDDSAFNAGACQPSDIRLGDSLDLWASDALQAAIADGVCDVDDAMRCARLAGARVVCGLQDGTVERDED